MCSFTNLKWSANLNFRDAPTRIFEANHRSRSRQATSTDINTDHKLNSQSADANTDQEVPLIQANGSFAGSFFFEH